MLGKAVFSQAVLYEFILRFSRWRFWCWRTGFTRPLTGKWLYPMLLSPQSEPSVSATKDGKIRNHVKEATNEFYDQQGKGFDCTQS
jgi:hypothetical protein